MKTQKCQPERHNLDIKNSSSFETIKAEPALVYIEQTENSQQGSFQKIDKFKNTLWNPHAKHDLIQEQLLKQAGQESMQDKKEITMDVFPSDRCTSGKFVRPKKTKGQAVSLIKYFNREQIREHIKGCNNGCARYNRCRLHMFFSVSPPSVYARIIRLSKGSFGME